MEKPRFPESLQPDLPEASNSPFVEEYTGTINESLAPGRLGGRPNPKAQGGFGEKIGDRNGRTWSPSFH